MKKRGRPPRTTGTVKCVHVCLDREEVRCLRNIAKVYHVSLVEAARLAIRDSARSYA